MPNNEILASLNSGEISMFKNDFFLVMKIFAELDRCYEKGKLDVSDDMKRFSGLIEKFHKKYDIVLKFSKQTDSLRLRIFVREKSIRDFFSNSASRIIGLSAIGLRNFNEADVGSENFSGMVERLENSVYLTYSDVSSGTSTLAALYDKKEKKVEILYDPADILNESSSEFRICAYYALKECDKRIKLTAEISAFGFYNILTDEQKKEWLKEFNPRFFE